MEEDHLGVLAAELDGAPDLRMHVPYRDRVRHDLLHEGHVERGRHRRAARTADGDLDRRARIEPFDLFKRTHDRCRLMGAMTTVFEMHHVVRGGIQDRVLGRCGADIDA